jgi:peptidoglycan/xylan/chitin deacetylase (PgdA/CDA1 family)
MTLQDIEADVLEAEKRLRELTGISVRSFAYPCYQDFVGYGLTRQSYVPVIAKHFVAARGGGEYPDNHPLTCDLHYLWSLKAEYLRGAELIGWAEWTAQRGRWLIVTFHGVDEGHLPISRHALQEFCDFLAQRSDIWTAPVVEVARRIVAWRRSQQL